jgi:hypothetical protein
MNAADNSRTITVPSVCYRKYYDPKGIDTATQKVNDAGNVATHTHHIGEAAQSGQTIILRLVAERNEASTLWTEHSKAAMQHLS